MANLSSIHALIIEDDKTSVDVLIDLFQQNEVNYTVLYDNRNVIPMLQQLDHTDVIFLDLEMPDNTGYEILKAIQSSPDFAHIPVVAYTSHSSEMANAREAGFHSFLGKPLRGIAFADQLEKIINKEPVWVVR